ncbi:RdgB/HAM1 family non-canonical purine NTP pyrophosphatase [Peptoniphilus sp. GNH]|nr:non-canonical purine NTP pyrophosphatase, RdgB/HAM1 family [Clostridiales bacterium KA00134]UHR02854.1 RdgB/HAM1 family non-canonical purine NTP pyrophosphatase [Peptoniphilus sp. GNH]
MKKIVLATDNDHKLEEIRDTLGDKFQILSKSQAGLGGSSPEENQDTLEKNALIKASHLAKKTNYIVIADDTGLFVEALDGKPGVHSARFSYDYGLSKDHDDRMNRSLLLKLLQGKDRRAYFKTVLCLIDENKDVHYLEGICKGEISDKEKGDKGFGYDSIFIPDGYDKTFAEMGAEKNKISHRARALEKLVEFFEKHK